MGNITSLHEIKALWLEVVAGLDGAQKALRKLDCEHQANCIADIQEAAFATLGAIELQIETLNDIESRMLFESTMSSTI